MDLDKLAGQIQTAQMLVALGVATVGQIRGYFASQGHDDEILAEIMLKVDADLARREKGPSFPTE